MCLVKAGWGEKKCLGMGEPMESQAEGNKHREKRWKSSIRHLSTRRAQTPTLSPSSSRGHPRSWPPSPEHPLPVLSPAPPEPPGPLTGGACPAPDPNPSPGNGVCSAVPIHSTETAPPRRGQGHPCHLLPALSRGTGTPGGPRPPCLAPAGHHSQRPRPPAPPKRSECHRRCHQPQSRVPWQSQPPKWKLQTQIFYLLNCC